MRSKSNAIYKLIVIAMCIAFITLCSWITLPFAVNFTLQLFAIFFISGCFPLSISMPAIAVYILIGLMGVPVFSGFNSGLSALLGASGGFIISFIFIALIVSPFQKLYSGSIWMYILTTSASLIVCYVFGCIWYMYVFCYSADCSLITAIAVCVLPFILIDILKISLSAIMLKKLQPYINRLPL